MDFRGWPENRSVLGVSGIRTRYQADGYDGIQSKVDRVEEQTCQIEWHHEDEQELITVSNV